MKIRCLVAQVIKWFVKRKIINPQIHINRTKSCTDYDIITQPELGLNKYGSPFHKIHVLRGVG
jgi:hypothetical protein